jgi:hypothetical protein
MNDESDGLAGALQELAREARRRQGPGGHPSPETLTAYHAGELTLAAEEEIQEHLAVCRHCTQLLLDLPAFLEPPVPHVESLDAAADASWQELRKRLPGPPEKAGSRPDAVTAWKAGPRRGLQLMAAAALIGLIAAPLWIIGRRLSSPPPPPEMAELFPSEGKRGMPEPSLPPFTVHADAASTALLVHLANEQPGLRFRVELRAISAPGAPAERPTVLPVAKALDSRTLLLLLARRQLPPGTYQLRVLDPEHPSAEALGDYTLRVVEP